MKEDCVLLEKLRKLQRVVHVLCAQRALGFKKDGKLRKLERYIAERSVPVRVLTSRHTEYKQDVSVQAEGTGISEIYSSSLLSQYMYFQITTINLLNESYYCQVMSS